MNVLYGIWTATPLWALILAALALLVLYFYSSFKRGFERYVERIIDRRLDRRRDRR